LPGGELVIQRGYLVQPIDDLFLGHRGCVATSSFRFLPESVASVEAVVFGSLSFMSSQRLLGTARSASRNRIA
jgi:hypothetical protein